MKKLLTIMIIAAAAQIACAGWVYFSVEETGDPTEFTISFSYTNDSATAQGGVWDHIWDDSYIREVTFGHPFEMKGFSSDNEDAVFGPAISWHANYVWGYEEFWGKPAYAYGVFENLSTDFDDVLLATFIYTGNLGDKITLEGLDVFNNEYQGLFTDASFEIVPEPMTFALLGLGGLFLRRRRA